MTHTPGPWMALLDNAGGGRNIGIEHKGRFIGIAHTSAVRAPNVLREREPIEEDEAKANALLIAAAPGLLVELTLTFDLLQTLSAYIPAHGAKMLEEYQARAVAIRNIITKATTPTDSNTKEEST